MAWFSNKKHTYEHTIGPTRESKKWAWAVSFALHVCLFGAFAVINLHAGGDAYESAAISRADIKTLQEQPLTLPKPSVRAPEPSADRQSFRPDRTAAEKPAFVTAEKREITPAIQQSIAAPSIAGPRAEFFGSRTSQRKICYVVDCSGSMLGFFSRVRTQLIDSINSLKPDQYFYIIFFHGGKLTESGQGRFERATPGNRAKAAGFIRGIKPGGVTNAQNALRRAMLIRDYSGNGPEQIYFLTDGFDFSAEDSEAVKFEATIMDIHKRLAPQARISTIGFWVEQADEIVLRELARSTRGDFVNIREK